MCISRVKRSYPHTSGSSWGCLPITPYSFTIGFSHRSKTQSSTFLLQTFCLEPVSKGDETQEASLWARKPSSPLDLALLGPSTSPPWAWWVRVVSRIKTVSSMDTMEVPFSEGLSNGTVSWDREKVCALQIPVNSLASPWTLCNIIYVGKDHLKPQSSITLTSRGLEKEGH